MPIGSLNLSALYQRPDSAFVCPRWVSYILLLSISLPAICNHCLGLYVYKTTLNRPLVLQKRIRRVNTKSCFDAPNSISDGSLLLTSPCLMRIIKRVQKSLKRFSWPSGASWLVSLSYYCIWCVFLFFSGFLKSSVVSAPRLYTRQWSTIASGLT